MQEQGMRKKSIQAEERYLTKRASRFGPEIILLKAEVCTHHPLTMTCSRFFNMQAKVALPSNDASWEEVAEKRGRVGSILQPRATYKSASGTKLEQ